MARGWADAPVNVAEFTFVRGTPECWSGLTSLEKDARKAQLTTLLTEECNVDDWVPTEAFSLGLVLLHGLVVDHSRVPNVHLAVLGAGHEVVRFAFVRVLSVNLDAAWDKFDVGDVALVRLVNVRHYQLFDLNGLLLALVFVLSVEVGGLLACWLAPIVDDMVC